MDFLRRHYCWLFLLVGSLALPAHAVTPTPSSAATSYNIPADLNKLFSNLQYPCTSSGSTYTCKGNPSITKESILNITAPITLRIEGTFSADRALFIRVPAAAKPFYFQIDGNFNTNAPMDITAEYLDVGGTFATSQNVTITANIRVGAQMAIRSDTIVYGDVTAGSEISIEGNSVVYGTCTAPYGNYPPKCLGKTTPPTPPAQTGLHHIRLAHAGTAATCTPAIVTAYACAGTDTNGACTAYTSGASGTVTGGGISAAFSIPSGSSSTTVSLPVTTASTVTLAASGFTASASPIYTCWNGSSASCSLTFADSALLLSIPNHYGGDATAFTVKAVRKSDKSSVCTPAFTGARQVSLACTYSNPASSTTALSIAPQGASASAFKCGSSTPTLSLNFDSTGSAPATLTYPNVGALAITLTDKLTALTGSDTFIAVPKKLVFTAPDQSGFLALAGNDILFSVTAQTTGNAVVSNLGKESSPESGTWTNTFVAPTGGVQTGFTDSGLTSFTAGVATGTFNWKETGSRTFTATLKSTTYLQSGLATEPAVLTVKFVPDHFDVTAASSQPFWYSGQPITDVTVTAKEKSGNRTSNFGNGSDGSVNLAITPATIAASSVTGSAANFQGGVATYKPTLKFANIATDPTTVKIGAMADYSAKGAESTVQLRSGRLKLFNATARLAETAAMPVGAQYWTSTKGWVTSFDDSFTSIPVNAVALTESTTSGVTALSAGLLKNGFGYIKLNKPSSGKGSVVVAVNLGGLAVDNACLRSHPATTASNMSWLRSMNGSCAKPDLLTDPWATAVFGVEQPESRSTIHVREIYN